MAKITGQKRHSQRLKKIRRSVPAAAGQAIFVGAGILETEARRLIVAGAVQGKGHVASAEGDPPNRDTGQLDQSIVALKTGKLTSEVEVGAPYGTPLEFGSKNMAERPFMRPATKVTRPKIVKIVKGAAARAVRKS